MAITTLKNACDFASVIALPCFVVSCDSDDEVRFQHFNPALVAILGIPSAVLRGKAHRECLPARVAETVLKNYTICIQSGRPYEYEELLDLNGREIWWQTSLSPILGEQGEVVGIIAIVVDITTQKAQEFKRTEAESALRRMNDEIALFTSMTAHDVRGPLNQIAALSELTLDGFADLGDKKRDMVLSMQQIAGGTLKHIDSILSYVVALRLGEADLTTLDLGHMCRDIAAVLDPEAKLSITSPDFFINSETVALQIILRNLAENAIRHAKGQLEISVAETSNGRLRFSVSDDGAGFPGGARAFDEKMHLREISAGNRGFGLAAVAHIVESRGGRTWLDTPVFKGGTTICFDLPGRIAWDREGTDLWIDRAVSG